MERQPKLTSKQLSQDRRVPRDGLLRGASTEEIVGGVRAWLANERPSHRGVTVTLAADEDAIRRVEQRWRRLCRNGYPNTLPRWIEPTVPPPSLVKLFYFQM